MGSRLVIILAVVTMLMYSAKGQGRKDPESFLVALKTGILDLSTNEKDVINEALFRWSRIPLRNYYKGNLIDDKVVIKRVLEFKFWNRTSSLYSCDLVLKFHVNGFQLWYEYVEIRIAKLKVRDSCVGKSLFISKSPCRPLISDHYWDGYQDQVATFINEINISLTNSLQKGGLLRDPGIEVKKFN